MYSPFVEGPFPKERKAPHGIFVKTNRHINVTLLAMGPGGAFHVAAVAKGRMQIGIPGPARIAAGAFVVEVRPAHVEARARSGAAPWQRKLAAASSQACRVTAFAFGWPSDRINGVP